MKKVKIDIEGIPAIIWGEKSDKVYLCVHGKMSSKEAGGYIAETAVERGYQVISFDLPEHGERRNEGRRCDIWNGMQDLKIIGDYVFDNWREVYLFACSLGAYFSLHTYNGRSFKKCLFQSPMLDMEYMIEQMMKWFDVSKERLEREKEIDTPIDIMTWDYYRYVREHPVTEWNIETSILYGGRDNFQSREIVESFAERFGCKLTVAENSEHPFMDKGDAKIVSKWLCDNII